MSGVPTASDDVPSTLTLTTPQVWPPKLNQKPQACRDPGSAQRRRVVRMVLRRLEHSIRPIAAESRPVGRRVPSCAAFLRRNSIGSMPIFWASSSTHALDGEGRHRRARRAVGGQLRPVDDDVVADRVTCSRS